MNVPVELKYTESHEWVRTEADGSITIGITEYAQDALGDIVYVELPAVGKSFGAGDDCAIVESVKAASDIYAPVAGEILAVNDELGSAPEKINENAYEAWMFKMKPNNLADVDGLLDAAGYNKNTA